MRHLTLPVFLFAFLSAFGQSSENLVPREASSVLSINNVNLLEKISLDELVQYRFMEELHHDIMDGSTAGWTLKDSGIDFDQKMNFFIGKESDYEVTGITFGIVNKEKLFQIFDDYELVESTISGVEMYASFFNRVAVTGNSVILFRIAPSYQIINDVTDSIWYARGNGYNWENEGEWEEFDDGDAIFEDMDEVAIETDKNYYELMDSVETAYYETYLDRFTENLFIKNLTLIGENSDFAAQMTSNSEGTYYVDNSANLKSEFEFVYLKNYYPEIFRKMQELYTGNVLSGDFYIEDNTIKLDVTAKYGETLGEVYQQLGSAKFDNNMLPYIHNNTIAYCTANLNVDGAYDFALETILSILNASDRPDILATALSLELANEFINKDALFDAYKGGAFMAYGGVKKIPIKKIVYEYDEETFDYIEREEMAEEAMPIFTFGMTTERHDVADKFLNYFSRIFDTRDDFYGKQKLINHGEYWELTNGIFNTVSLFIINKNGVLVVTNDAVLAQENSDGFGKSALSKKDMKLARKGGSIYAHADMNRAISELPQEMFSERDNELLNVFRGKSGTVQLTSTKSTGTESTYAVTYTFESEEDSGTYILDLINSLYVISK